MNAVRLGTDAPAARSLVKRLLDTSIAALGILVLLPVCLLVALAILLDSGWPPLFLQDRIGRAERRFRVLKFRTMTVGAEHSGAGLWIKPNDTRVTRVGGFLRQASLDELPQLWNVLRGDMSLVGPRPLHPTTVARLSDEQKGRHRVRPGVTGWAVLNGRNSIPYSRRIELDNWYIENWSLGLDLRILLRTVPAVVFRSGLKMDQLAAEIDDLQGQPLAHSERSGD